MNSEISCRVKKPQGPSPNRAAGTDGLSLFGRCHGLPRLKDFIGCPVHLEYGKEKDIEKRIERVGKGGIALSAKHSLRLCQ